MPVEENHEEVVVVVESEETKFKRYMANYRAQSQQPQQDLYATTLKEYLERIETFLGYVSDKRILTRIEKEKMYAALNKPIEILINFQVEMLTGHADIDAFSAELERVSLESAMTSKEIFSTAAKRDLDESSDCAFCLSAIPMLIAPIVAAPLIFTWLALASLAILPVIATVAFTAGIACLLGLGVIFPIVAGCVLTGVVASEKSESFFEKKKIDKKIDTLFNFFKKDNDKKDTKNKFEDKPGIELQAVTSSSVTCP
ncbi:MAG: hypothetical protein K2Q14_02825 [Gammaproteobacteria bacterium]|nr:hypothetical protein [Gammaproteobacteria bacterium]